MSTEQIAYWQKRARHVAFRKGYPELADDFAQEIFINFCEDPDRGATVDQLFIDYLRKSYGRPGTPLGDARVKARLSVSSLDDAKNIAADPEPERDDGECAFLFGGIEAELYEAYFVNERSLADIGEDYDVTESRICQRVGGIKKKITEYYEQRFLQARLEEDPHFTKLSIQWIRL